MHPPVPNTTTPAEHYISRDLSWLKFNQRVLDQATHPTKTLAERLQFLSISATNLDEFFMIRVGSPYNYIDYQEREQLLAQTQTFFRQQHHCFLHTLLPACSVIHDLATLSTAEQAQLKHYFQRAIFPMLTPIAFDSHHPFPLLADRVLVFGVVTPNGNATKTHKKVSFIQLPRNLARFHRLQHPGQARLVPIEVLIKAHLGLLFKNVEILSTTFFRIIRNGDLSLDDIDDVDANFVEAFRRKLKTRDQGRVVRLEVAAEHDPWLLDVLQQKWTIDAANVFPVPPHSLVDLSGAKQLGKHQMPTHTPPVPPLSYPTAAAGSTFDWLRQHDVLLHHPYNSFNIIVDLLEQAAADQHVLAIKMTIYRLAPESAITAALLSAVRNGKHVSVLFEIKARFDEEHNIEEARKLEKAGCFVIYGIGSVKTHAKLMMIVRQEDDRVTRYVHLASGNYNEETALQYTDIGLLTADESYAHDVAEFFNVITGHSMPHHYENLLTTPLNLRQQLINLIRQEAQHARQSLSAGIVIKVNALEDKTIIDELYKASQSGVRIHLIIRGICCLIPGRPGLSERITVRSIVGNFLEHARIFYFHQQGTPQVYGGSADLMVRSFERRIEALFAIRDPTLQQQVIHLLACNLQDNVNAYQMQTDGAYTKLQPGKAPPFDIHKAFFHTTPDEVHKATLFA